jgi:hypothetical protein
MNNTLQILSIHSQLVAHWFVIKMALQKGTTQRDKVVYSPIHQGW